MEEGSAWLNDSGRMCGGGTRATEQGRGALTMTAAKFWVKHAGTGGRGQKLPMPGSPTPGTWINAGVSGPDHHRTQDEATHQHEVAPRGHIRVLGDETGQILKI